MEIVSLLYGFSAMIACAALVWVLSCIKGMLKKLLCRTETNIRCGDN